MTSKELLEKWRTQESEQITPERAKICKDFVVLLENAINEGDEASLIGFTSIQDDINSLQFSLGCIIGLPEYLEIKNNKSNKVITAKDIVERNRDFGVFFMTALNMTIKDMESES